MRYELVVAGLCVSLVVSCGYHFVGSTNTIPDHIQSISVKTFQNATTEYKIEQHITRWFVRELISRTRYQLVDDDKNADAVLNGTVLNFLVFPAVLIPVAVVLQVFPQLHRFTSLYEIDGLVKLFTRIHCSNIVKDTR